MKYLLFILFLFVSINLSAEKLYPIIFNGNLSYMNSKGEVVISPEGKYLSNENLDMPDFETEFSKIFYTNKNQRLKDYVFPDYANFSEGKVTIENKHWFWFIFFNSYKSYSVMDYKGKLLKSFGDTIIHNFKNGYTKFEYTKKETGNRISEKAYGFINEKLDVVIPAEYDYVGDFKDELVLVRINEKYGFINTDNTLVIPMKYEAASGFSNGLAPVKTDGKWGFINKSGEFSIEPKFDLAWEFSDGIAMIYINDRFRYIRTDGKYLNDESYDNAFSFSSGLAKVKIGDYYGFIDKNGEIKIEPEIISCLNAQCGMIGYRDGSKWGFMDIEGDIKIKPQYDFVKSFDGELAIVWKDGEQVYINKSGEVVSKMKRNTVNFIIRLFD
jgi:hypothetical protein